VEATGSARSAMGGSSSEPHEPQVTIDVQLLKEWDGHSIPENAVCEEKIDGVRAVIVFAGDRYCCYSRLGNVQNNVGHIAKELIGRFDGWVLDGELIAGDFGGTISALHSAECGAKEARFVVFDALTHDEFDSTHTDRTLAERRKTLIKMFPRAKYSSIIKQKRVKTAADVKKAMTAYVKNGFEGAVLKDLDSCYEFKRGRTWVKIKPFKSGDYRIADVIEGEGKYEGMLGKIIVRGPKGVESGVGTGFTDAQRAKMWKQRRSLIGKVAEVSYQEISSGGKLRFPSFSRMRPDR